MEFDDVLKRVGEFGPFQCLNFALLLLPVAHTAIYMMSYVFAARDIPYRCYVPECDSLEATPQLDPPWLHWAVPPSPLPRPWPHGRAPAPCLRYQPAVTLRDLVVGKISVNACSPETFSKTDPIRCDRWVFSEDDRTLVSEFSITCEENRWRLTAVGSLNFLGQLLGMPFSGVFSDRFGRRGLMMVVVPLSWVCGMARSFAASYNQYLLFEFLDAFVASGLYSACFILGVELVAGRQRVVGSAVLACFYSLGCVFLGTVAWLQRDWRLLIRLAYVPTGLSALGIWLLPESVRWLLSRNRVEDAQAVLKRVATVNRVPLTEPLVLRGPNITPCAAPAAPTGSSRGVSFREAIQAMQAMTSISEWPLLQVLGSGILVRRLFLTATLWVVNSFVYFGLALRSVALAGDLYLNFILAALVEIPSYVLAWLVSERWGRRVCVSSCLALTGGALLAFLVLPTGWLSLQLWLYLTGKLAITASFTVLYVFTAELFPTSARHSMIGLCSTVGRVGSMLAPQTPLLEVFFWGMPILVFGLMCVGGAFLVLFLPETLNNSLPDSISDAKAVGRTPASITPTPQSARQ